jgi:hypothetical protein
VSDTPRDADDDTPTGELPIGGQSAPTGGGLGGSSAGPDAPASGGLSAGPDAPASGGLSAGPDAPASGGLSAGPDAPASGGLSAPTRAGNDATAPVEGGVAAPGAGSGEARGAAAAKTAPRRRLLSFGPLSANPDYPDRRRRRWFGTGIAVAAAIVVIALCAGALSVVSAVNDARDRAADARAARTVRENDCLDLEKRLNRLVPPGSTTSPAARATAIRDENAAVRIYVDRLATQRVADAWRQLLDARTVFADALDRQAKSRTPAFYVAPRADDGTAVADQLVQWSPEPCAGSIRRLAVPEL